MYIDESLAALNLMQNDERPAQVVIGYHAKCMDGLVAATVMASAVRAISNSATIELRALEYQGVSINNLLEHVSIAKPNFVYIVDFSIAMDTLEAMAQFCAHVFVLDHHKTAFEMYFPSEPVEEDSVAEYISDKIYIKLDNAQSGAGLVYSEVMEQESLQDCSRVYKLKTLVQYVQDRDLWKFELAESKAVNTYIKWAIGDFSDFYGIPDISKVRSTAYTLNDHPLDCISKGKSLLATQAELIKSAVARASKYRIHGVSMQLVVVNETEAELTSEIGNELAKGEEGMGAIVYFQPDGKCKLSLRSIGDIDVTTLTKQFGGGGHKNAGGCMLPDVIANFIKESPLLREV